MTAVIDSLVLEFGLDPAAFTKGQREAMDQLRRFEQEAEKVGGRAEVQGRKVVDMMSAFRREALGALGLFLGGRTLQGFIEHMTQLDASTGKAALTFNMSASELSTWQGAMQQTGGRAESMRGTIGGLTQDMNKFMLTGQGVLAGLLRPIGVSLTDDNDRLKDAGQLILDIVAGMDRVNMDPARRAAFLSMLPGMNEDSINLMMRSRRELEEVLNVSRRLGTTTAESARQAQEYQRALAGVERSAESLGRTLLTKLGPSITKLFDDITENMQKGLRPHAGKGSFADFLLNGQVQGGVFSIEGWKNFFSGAYSSIRDYDPSKERATQKLGDQLGDRAADVREKQAGGTGPAKNTTEVVNYIRAAAIKRGIDPDVAVRVAQSEGLYNYIGDKGSSFGPFQLHYGGVAPGMMQPGLGDEFTRKTGLNARDEATWRQQIDFALDQAARPGGRGWADWYGARNTGISQFQGIGRGGGAPQQNVTVGSVTINTQAKDGKEVAETFREHLQNGTIAPQFNTGAE